MISVTGQGLEKVRVCLMLGRERFMVRVWGLSWERRFLFCSIENIVNISQTNTLYY